MSGASRGSGPHTTERPLSVVRVLRRMCPVLVAFAIVAVCVLIYALLGVWLVVVTVVAVVFSAVPFQRIARAWKQGR